MNRISMMILMIVCAGSAVAADGALTAVIDWSQWDTILRDHVVEGHVDYDWSLNGSLRSE
jgi:hypothetical protein